MISSDSLSLDMLCGIGISVLQPGTEPVPTARGERTLNHWTTQGSLNGLQLEFGGMGFWAKFMLLIVDEGEFSSF